VYQAAVWNVFAQEKCFTVPAPPERVPGTTALSADGLLLATAHQGKDTLVRIWDVRTGKEACTFKRAGLARVFFNNDNTTLIIAGAKIAAVDIRSAHERFSWRMPPLKSSLQVTTVAVGGPPFDENTRIVWRALAISPDDATIAAIHQTFPPVGQNSGEDRIALYDLASGKLLHHWNDSGIPANMYEAMTFSGDGRLLASSDGHVVHVWETASGKEVMTFKGHRAEITSLGFDRGARRLVSTSFDSTVLVWDLTGRLDNGKLRPGALTAGDLETRWRDLADPDVGKAYRAVWELTAAGERAVSFLKQRLRPVPHPDQKRIEQLINDLTSGQFAVRESASTELQKLDVLAENALQKAVQANPPLELRRRIERLLQGIQAPVPSADVLQKLRALAALEHLGTADARELLQTLGEGAPAHHVTRAARAARGRLVREAK
jgi:hypothetical protein